MSRYAQPMSQTLAEMKMNDPKLNKIFDKLKKGSTVKIKHSSTLERGKDFIEYIVKSKNVVNKGRVEKITLASKDNPTAVKKFLYKRDGKVTFAVGDMAASIDDIKEELEEGYESEVLKVLDDAGIDGYFRNGKLYVDRRDAKAAKDALEDADNIMKLPKMVKEEVEDLEERMVDPADVDDDATDADKKAADKNIIMQMRKAMDVKGNMKIEFGDGKKEKVDPKILQMMVTAHGKIQKPRDKEKFVAMIGKSKRDMLTVAKKLSTLKMDLDKEDEPVIKKVIDMLKKASGAHAGQAKDLEKAMTEGAMKDLLIKGQDLEAYAKKHGGIDKKDMMKVAAMLKKGDKSGALKYAKGMDTDPRDYILDLMGEGLDERDKKNKYVRPMDRKFSDTEKSNIQINKEVQALYDRIMGKTGIKYKREFMRGVPGRKNKQTHVIVVNKKDKNAANKAVKNYNFSPIEKEVFVRKGHFVVFAVDNLDDRASWYKEEVELGEKYELYHKTFSDAMQHAYDYAKKKLGITVDPKEIDNKVATGPRKPSEGKTNKYRLKGKGGNLQIQVYNKGGSKPFELNMYKEENEMKKSLKDTILEMRKEGFASDAQRKAAFASGYKEKGKKKDKEEGNEFSGALDKARKAGKKTFKVGGKEYPVEPAKKESVERYHETKQGSLRESILQMWGEVNEKVEYAVYIFKNERDAKAAKSYFDGIQLMSFDINDDNIRNGELLVDAGTKDMTKYHKEVIKKFRPKVKYTEKKDLTKEKKDDTKKMTDTGKEVTPVETSVKMPKIKETKNKV